MRLRTLVFGLLLLSYSVAAEPEIKVPKDHVGALSPREELATIKLLKGFKAELVASEPDVIDPVAMCFDFKGRLFVCEMRGYPNGGVGTGMESRGRIRMLEDENGDGVFEKSTVFADGLRFPTGVMAWRNGIIVANAPDLIYLEDTDGDGKADKKRILYTGFGLSNIQQLINTPQWALDNWIYVMVGGATGGTITCPEKPDMKPLVLRGRGIRFKPDHLESLEAMSGVGQYGLAPDDFEHWFTATNSQHLRQIVLPDYYLARNPYLTVPLVSFDIPDHGAACKLNRISPFEGWRVERTTARKEGPDAKRFPSTELLPGGFVTSSCSPVVYTANLYPPEFRNNTFVCDPANNLIHRDILEVNGSLFSAKRGDADCEFFASTDNWCRPVSLCVGPEGALYVLDFYREIIETPLSLPEDIKKRWNLESRNRGRIWRVAPEGFHAGKLPDLSNAMIEGLVELLDHPVMWQRLAAQQLLVNRADKKAVPLLTKLAASSKTAVGRVHALWALEGLNALEKSHVLPALEDPDPNVREQALRLAERFAPESDEIVAKMLALVDDPSPHLRLQLAFSLGAAPAPKATQALGKLLLHPKGDSWLQSAVLSSSRPAAVPMIEWLGQPEVAKAHPGTSGIVSRLAVMVGAEGNEKTIAHLLQTLASGEQASDAWKLAVIEGLGQGMQNSAKPLYSLWEKPPETLAKAVEAVKALFQKTAATANDPKQSEASRLAAIRFLAYGPFPFVGPIFTELLSPQQSTAIQAAVVKALASRGEKAATSIMIAAWERSGPSLRRELLESLCSRQDRVTALLEAIESKRILAAHLESSRQEFLRKHPSAAVRKRANELLGKASDSDRKKIVETYADALKLDGDTTRGKALFQKNCSVCHRLDNVGHEVGANLMAALRTKSKQALIIDILDPSREVDSRYVNYRVTTLNGRGFTGILAVETPSSITLRRAENAEDTILRTQIDTIEATSKSLMPEEFEKQLSKQDVADVIAYLLGTVAK